MKKWMLAWLVFTTYLIANMIIMETAEQPHLIATFLFGFFIYLIFGIRGVYGAMATVALIVLLALIAHQIRHPYHGLSRLINVLLRLLFDLITLSGGGGLAHCVIRLWPNRSQTK
jgi:hypothetical protein